MFIQPAPVELLLLCHTEEHLRNLARKVFLTKYANVAFLDRDNADLYYSPGTLLAARFAVGGAVDAVKSLFEEGSSKRRVCSEDGTFVTGSIALVRPPGHHCCENVPAGFCFFNNTATAVEYARKKLGLKRVAVVDLDYHPGDGTQRIFYKEQVLTISAHVACRVRFAQFAVSGFRLILEENQRRFSSSRRVGSKRLRGLFVRTKASPTSEKEKVWA